MALCTLFFSIRTNSKRTTRISGEIKHVYMFSQLVCNEVVKGTVFDPLILRPKIVSGVYRHYK